MPNSLAYLGISTPAVEAWDSIARNVLGCMITAPDQNGARRLKFDDYAWRVELLPGESDDIAFIGWDVNTLGDLEAQAERVRAAGIEVHRGDVELARARNVKDLIWFMDPFGFRHEVIVGLVKEPASFHPTRPMTGFVTGPQGLGHVVLGVPDIEAAHAFFTEVLEFRISDWLQMSNGFEGRFYHCNGRHHTLALGELDNARGMNHLMVEVNALDDVGIALDHCLDADIPVVNDLGRHTNDEMTSFYFQTPSGFLIEYGYSGIQIGEDWSEKTFYEPSIWGHRNTDGHNGAGLIMPVVS